MKKEFLNTQIDGAIKAIPNTDLAGKKALQDFQKERESQFTEVVAKKEETRAQVLTETKQKTLPFKRELLENTPMVQDFAPHINLGGALVFIKEQTGDTSTKKLAAAKKTVQESGIAYAANSNVRNDKIIGTYFFSRSQNSDINDRIYNSKRAIEASKLIDFIDALEKDSNTSKHLLTSNIPADRLVDKGSILDLVMDFDDDGVLESINSTDKSGMWKRLTSALGFGTAMQSEFMGEIQARKNINENTFGIILKKYNIEKNGDKESTIDFAKRIRSTLLLRADMLQSTDMSASAEENMYENSKKNRESLAMTTKLVTELRKGIITKIQTTTPTGNAQISTEQVNNIANQMSANILRFVTTVGVGSINMDTFLSKAGQAVVSGKAPGIESFLALDQSVIINLLKTETLK